MILAPRPAGTRGCNRSSAGPSPLGGAAPIAIWSPAAGYPTVHLAHGSRPRERIPYSLAARELLRNTLLDAACDELSSAAGWTSRWPTSPALPASAARPSTRSSARARSSPRRWSCARRSGFLVAVEEAVNANLADPATALSAAFDVFLTAAAENPLVRTIVAGEGAEGLLVLLTTHGEPLVEAPPCA